ncbi:alpha/beta hydrolase family protein [Actinomycetospora succinea]|uniref:Alpha/beta hydrolase family protein n=1 Tax=Actinomycetospora succinea TaxID=663603 RepID=A0A4R6V455_9PSEU|nr:alpha/beta hydrolase family protein [Actinomycetospora succinea]
MRWWGHPFREARLHLELTRLLLSATWRGEDVPHGAGAPVLLVPGFLAGDVSLTVLHDWLRRIGHRSYRSGIVWNVDCSEAAVRRLDRRLAEVADRAGEPVTLVGHSRGGLFARALAVRSPGLVRRVVALGSPLASQLDASVLTLAAVSGARVAQNLVRPHRPHCLTVRCPCAFSDDLVAPTPPPVVAIWSAEDGIVRPSSCRPDDAECREVRGSHVGLGVNVEVYRHLAEILVRR